MRHPRRATGDERGAVLVWTALALVLLIGMAAFAIDVSFWYLTQSREQKAADAAALAGAVNFPSAIAQANGDAQTIAAKNGYSVTGVQPFQADGSCPLGTQTNVAICTGPGSNGGQYKVKVTERVNNIFGGIFGLGHATLSATATAEYLKPLSLGSPSNQFGNDPDKVSWPINAANPPTVYPNFWGVIEGGGTAKEQGDAYAAGWCNTTPTDGCNGQGDGPTHNVDYTGGYYYTVDVAQDGPFNLQVFDPAFTDVNGNCADATGTSLTPTPLGKLAAFTGNIPFYPGTNADRKIRYAPVKVIGDPGVANPNHSANGTLDPDPTDPGYRYCAGDQSFPNSAGARPAPTTTYTISQAGVPGLPSSGQNVAGCPSSGSPDVYPGFTASGSQDLYTMLTGGKTVTGSTHGPLATYFRQWQTICTINARAGDEYFVHITTDNGAGSNSFALRAVTSGGGAAPVNIAGNTSMAIYANVGGKQHTRFYLVRLPNAAKGHTLVLNFYDIGDADSVGQLQVLPPTDSNLGSTFSDTNAPCTWTGNASTGAKGYSSNTVTAPWGPATPISQCLITGVNGGGGSIWQAQWSQVKIPIPDSYNCTDDSQYSGCWVTIDYLFQGTVHDVTTWGATLLGDPVRLVK